ncbi:MAG: membrane assembly protein AsmA, partial [Bacteroidia bacterium]|nr:membrane assembly protein AsmA [Bacteroidia bacterium]
PNLSIGIENLTITNVEPFAGDTLVYSKDLRVVVDIMSVIGGKQIAILKISADNPVMNFLVTKEGKANWDVTKPGKEKAAAPAGESSFNVKLKKYSISEGRIVYDDKSLGFSLEMSGLNHTGSGDFTQDLFTLSTKTISEKTSVTYGGVNYLSNAKADIDADLDMDMKNMKFTFKDNKVRINELELAFSGWLAMSAQADPSSGGPKEKIDMDLKFAVLKSDFKNFISMIPAIYKAGTKDLKSSGTMGFDGFVKGTYSEKSLPGFSVNLKIQNGMFQYPSLPAAVNNVQVDLKINNPDGVTDHTVVNLSNMHVEVAGEAFDARLLLKTPISDPDIDAALKGKINLGNMQKIVPLEKGTELSGIIAADFSAKGKYSTVQKKSYEDFDAKGTMELSGFTYSSEDKPKTTINIMKMTFNPKEVALNSFSAKTSASDFNASGSLQNFIAYALRGETLKGNLQLSSSLIDLNEWMTGTPASKAATDTTSLSVIEIPENIDFTLNASVKKFLYEDMTMDNLKGTLIVKDKAIRMKDVYMQLLDGHMVMNGTYDTKEPKKPTFSFDMAINDFDVQKTSATFVTVQKMAPIVKNCSGKYSTTMKAEGLLDEHMNPVMASLNGFGNLKTSTLTLQNFTPLVKVADALKMEKLKKTDIAPTNLSFKFANGRVTVDPFDVSLGGFKSKVGGSNGFDQTIDYTVASDIPRDAFGGAASSVLSSLTAKTGVVVGETIPVEIKIGGTFANPTISTNLNKMAAKAMDDLKAKAKEELEKKKKELEDKARAEVDKMKKEAEDKVRAEVDKVKQEAEAKAKAEVDRLKKEAADKAKKEVGNKLNDLFKKPK